jgi:hypothetical protein
VTGGLPTLVVVNSTAAAVLTLAAAAKLASPTYVSRAIRELTAISVPSRAVRLFALGEFTVGFCLSLPGTRSFAAVAVGALGIAFAIVGVTGKLRRATVGCGCFGVTSHRPLGLRSAVVGLGLALVLPLNHATTLARDTQAHYVRLAPAVTALASLALAMSLHRQIVNNLAPWGLDDRFRSSFR